MSDEVSCIGNCVEKYLHLDFKKLNYIFLPINENQHWSLFIIINPGLVTNYSPQERSNPDFETESFLVILDSLTYHNPDKIARVVRRWSNDLWKQ
jgi:Ulp1 family protease